MSTYDQRRKEIEKYRVSQPETYRRLKEQLDRDEVDNSARAWGAHLVSEEFDPEGKRKMRKLINERKYKDEGDGWMKQPEWR